MTNDKLDQYKKLAFSYLKDKEIKPNIVGIYYRVDDVAQAIEIPLSKVLEEKQILQERLSSLESILKHRNDMCGE